VDEAVINSRLAVYDKAISSYPKFYDYMITYDNNHTLDIAQKLYLRVFVPALTGYVEWVLQDAFDRGIKRLFFLSRDGFQMYLIGKALCEARSIDIECRYINVSRYSMRVPAYHLDTKKALDQICVGGIDITLTKILKRAALTDAEITQVISDINWQGRQDKILNYSEIMALKDELSATSNIYTYIERHSKECYRDAVGYLNQEGLLDGIRCALVDSGWIGTLQDSIEMLVKSVKPSLVLEGYYFGMYEIPEGCDSNKYHPYYFAPGKGIGRKVSFANSLFETVISADEGMALGYRVDGERYVAIKDTSGNPNREQMKENIHLLDDFLTGYNAANSCKIDVKKLINITEKVMRFFMSTPTEVEVAAYGDNRFSADLLEGSQKKVAAELTYRQIKDQWFVSKLLIMRGVKKATIYESAWLEGSAVRCGKRVNTNLRHIRWYKYFVYFRKGMRKNR